MNRSNIAIIMSETAKQEIDPRKLYIRNLAFEVVKDDIRKAFEPFGIIEACDVPMEKPNKCKG